jgi:serine/threonine-protein kinase
MSPEQAAGDKDIDGRSDLYSLACVLYEALAGVPAFVGATPQAVVAQRLTHEPRPIRVYRPSVTQGLEAVLTKALATAPADRYQTADEFAAALQRAASGAGGLPRSRRRPVAPLVYGGLLLVAAVALAIPSTRARIAQLRTPRTPLDTARVAIFSFAGGAATDSLRPDGLIFEGLRHWRGLRLVPSFEIGDLLRRRGTPTSVAEARALAVELAAGRFVRGSFQLQGSNVVIEASLYQAETDSVLHSVHAIVPFDSARSLAVYRSLGDSLVLRSKRLAGPADTTAGERSLPAVQAMILAGDALREWDLPRAESLYTRAIEFEPASARAAFWLAQTQAWNQQPKEKWRGLIERAAADTAALVRDEVRLAGALRLLAVGDYPEACSAYRAITEKSPREFAGWFGLGQCLEMDHVVVPSPTRPGQWQFRSSYHRAILAYTNAFARLPSVYQSFRGSAYARVREILYTSYRYRRSGQSAAAPVRNFMAAPELVADTLVFVPQPLEEALAGKPIGDSTGKARAILRTREMFRQITASWSSAFPRSAGAKEGLALSLEIQGDPAAIDTLLSALRLATDSDSRLRISASLAWMRLKVGLPGDSVQLEGARRMADSIVSNALTARVPLPRQIGRLAVITGQCNVAADVAQHYAEPRVRPVAVATRAVGEANARGILISMGCAIPASRPGFDQIVENAQINAASPALRGVAIQQLLVRSLRVQEPFDTTWIAVVGISDPVIAARLYIQRQRADSARSAMMQLRSRRLIPVAGDFTPDAAIAEARVWLALGDTAQARTTLDESLLSAKRFPPLDAADAFDELAIVSSAIRASQLRAELSQTPSERHLWAQPVAILWKRADESLQAVVQRSKTILAK